MTVDARSSPIHDLPLANALDGTEIVAVEQLLDPARPEIGTRDVKVLVSALGTGGGGLTGDPVLWVSGEPLLWVSGEPIDWVS